MPLSGPGYDILGVTLDGPLPLGPIDLELSVGTTTLYGRNGAGKSRVLAGTAAALEGVSVGTEGLAMVHLQVHERDVPMEGPFLDELRGALADGLRDQRRRKGGIETLVHPEHGTLEYYADWVEQRDDLTTATWADLAVNHASIQGAHGELADWVGWSGACSLLAVGTAEAPAWDVWVSCRYDLGEAEQAFVPAYDAARDFLRAVWDGDDDPAEAAMRAVTTRGISFSQGLAAAFIRRGHRPGVPPGPVSAMLPGWVPVPLFRVGHISASPVDLVGLTEAGRSDAQLRELTLDALAPRSAAGQRTRPITQLAADQATLAPEAAAALEQVERIACELATSLLDRAPALSFALGTPDEWLAGTHPVWVANDPAAQTPIPLSQTSRAQHRWLSASVELSLTPATVHHRKEREERPVVLLGDEPEAGLHRIAERQLARGLDELAQRLGAAVLVASHSPALLELPSTSPLHITRDLRGRVVARSARVRLGDGADLALLREEAGLSPSDLLQLMTLALLVEGEHDDLVLRGLLPDDVGQIGVRLIRLHGAKYVRALLDAELLIDFTDARIMVILDNLRHVEVQEAWRAAQEALVAGDEARARAALLPLRRMDGGEPKWLAQLGLQAIDRFGTLERVRVFGLTQPDVICYLPPDAFVPGATSWEPLLHAWRAEAAEQHAPARDIKGWLEKKRRHHQKITSGDIEAAVERARNMPLHDDLVHLALQLQAGARLSQSPA